MFTVSATIRRPFHIPLVALSTALLSLGAASGSANADSDATPVFGFEVSGAWHSVPRHVLEVNAANPRFVWSNRYAKQPMSVLDSGVALSTAHVKEGQFSGLWKDHEKYPTIACWDIPHDWSGANAIEVSIYSERATGEIVTVGALSDSTDTPWRDYYLRDFAIDWTGWKTLTFPFASFRAFERPAGWNKIDALYFFTKAFRNQPNPYTELSLDAIHLRTVAEAAPAPSPSGFVYSKRYEDQQRPLNQPYPETSHPEPFDGPIEHQSYFQTERELFKYYPRFNTGYPSFDPAGKAYVNSGDSVEWVGKDGKWQASDIKAVLIDWAKKQGWSGLYMSFGIQADDPMIRFDNDGDAYALESVERLNERGERYDWHTRASLLLYSRDHMKSWQVYKLPQRMAAFEKREAWNADCLKRPPVITMLDYSYFPGSDQNSYILIPEKKRDGTLTLPDPVAYGTGIIGAAGLHSGDANTAITHGDTVTLVYGWCPDTSLQTGDFKKEMPPIPDGHPGLTESYLYKDPKGVVSRHYGSEGVPTYVVDYDIKTRKLTKPVYIGSAGVNLDGHNWPAITVDSKGILSVLMNGHHRPVNFTHTLKPFDITAWTAPEYLHGDFSSLTYATLTCGNDDTLYTVHRSSKDNFDDRLCIFTKPAGGDWAEERKLVVPFKNNYKVWYQRMTYDPKRNRLFLTYFSDAYMEWFTWDMFDFYSFVWPDREKAMYANFGKPGATEDIGPHEPGVYSGGLYHPGASEITMLVSGDEGKTWHLATTKDFE